MNNIRLPNGKCPPSLVKSLPKSIILEYLAKEHWEYQTLNFCLSYKPVDAVYSPDGNFIALVSKKNSINLYNRKEYDVTMQLRSESPDKIQMIRFSADGKQILIVSNLCLQVISTDSLQTKQTPRWIFKSQRSGCERTAKVISRWKFPESMLHDASFSTNGKCVQTIGCDQKIRTWNVLNGECVKTIDIRDKYAGGACNASLNCKHNLVVTKNNYLSFNVWCMKTGKLLTIIRDTGSRFRNLKITPNGKYIVADSMCDIALWDIKTGERLDVNFTNGTVCDFCFDESGQNMISWSCDYGVFDNSITFNFWKIVGNKIKRVENKNVQCSHGINNIKCMTLHPNGREALLFWEHDTYVTDRVWRLLSKHTTVDRRYVEALESY